MGLNMLLTGLLLYEINLQQEERQAIIRVFKEIQEDKRVVEAITNLKFFGE